MIKHLRPYQKKAISECIAHLKKDDQPVLLMASVGSGKSLMISEILLLFERQKKRALCLVNNAELIRNNAETYRTQGGNPSVYCASLGEKSCSSSIVFGTPQSVLNGINKNSKIANIKFNIIIVDEAHMINYNDNKTTFMRILRHYKQEYPAMRVLGATGTNFRYKGEPIVGDKCLFKSQVGNITTEWLIDNGYLIKPKFEIDEDHAIDFSSVKLNSMGKFDSQQLETVVERNFRLTTKIMWHLRDIMERQDRFGCFIFCSTLLHCEEAYLALPRDKTAIITGKTPQKERIDILDKARHGEIKYLINVQVLTVGIDVPGYDTLVFLRPTESLVLAVQMIGRALRLFPNKKEALILDCAGNIERHSDWDSPLLLEAIKQTRDAEQELIFECHVCHTFNSLHARRCVGIVNGKRCDHYFDFKECPSCSTKNDIVSRQCRACNHELIDPNAKLCATPFVNKTIKVQIKQAEYWLQESGKYTRFHARYLYLDDEGKENKIEECFLPSSSEKAKNIFYGQFVKKHLKDGSYWYPHLNNPIYLKSILAHVETPAWLTLKYNENKWIISKKVFLEKDNPQ